MKRLVVPGTRRQGRRQLFCDQARVTNQRHISVVKFADVGPACIDLNQGHIGNGRAEAGCPEIEAGAENQHTICLIDVTACGPVSERTDDTEVIRVAPEHLLAAGSSQQQCAKLLCELLQSIPCSRTIGAYPRDDEGFSVVFEQFDCGLDRMGPGRFELTRRGCRPIQRVLFIHLDFRELDTGWKEQRHRMAQACGIDSVQQRRSRTVCTGGPENL